MPSPKNDGQTRMVKLDRFCGLDCGRNHRSSKKGNTQTERPPGFPDYLRFKIRCEKIIDNLNFEASAYQRGGETQKGQRSTQRGTVVGRIKQDDFMLPLQGVHSRVCI